MDEKYIPLSAAVAIIEEKQRELCPVGRFSRNAIYGSDRNRFDDLQETIDAIEAIEPADVQPVVHGSWRAVSFHEVACTKCGYVVDIMKADADHMKFCNECGADMMPEQRKEQSDV